jgi:hypothetical protein
MYITVYASPNYGQFYLARNFMKTCLDSPIEALSESDVMMVIKLN